MMLAKLQRAFLNNNKKMPLNSKDRNVIKSLSQDDVEQTLAGLKRFTNSFNWVAKNNRYSLNTIKKIVKDTKSGGPLREPRHLSQYIAASCLLHCSDGWSYLGKSILSLLRGDPHRSRHLAYYAELRAAMSLLATSGIGVFDKKHFVIDAPSSVSSLKLKKDSPTHRFVWNCLESWGGLKISGELFSSIITPNGCSLDEWLQPLGGGVAVAPKAKQWFLQWGMDLKTPTKDRDARNESSYRPDGIPNSWRLDAPNVLKFVSEIWASFEPSAISRFDMIDRHILRIALESVFTGQTGKKPTEDQIRFRKLVERVVDAQNLTDEAKPTWIKFLCRKTDPEDLSILKLSKLSPEAQDNGHTATIARAALLLRVASGSTSKLFKSAGFTTDSISFWWDNMGRARGLWDGTKASKDLLDLWADILPLLQDIDQFQKKYPIVDQTFYRVGNELSHVLVGLGGCERIAVWGLTPS